MSIKSRLINVILLVIILLSFGCARKSELPKEIPGNLEIKANTTLVGGRSPSPNIPGQSLFRWIVISGNEMTFERVRCEGTTKITLTDAEMKTVYQSFVENEFDLIEIENSSKNAQEGFEEINLRAANITKNVKSGKEFPLSEKDRKRFNRVWVVISELAEERIGHCPA